jgi:HPt (histidine-containing phosphotransfer) domain-containing protein
LIAPDRQPNKPIDLELSLETGRLVDPAVVDRVLDQPLGQVLCMLFLDAMSQLLTDLALAIERQDPQRVQTLARGLKHTSQVVGATWVAALSVELEQSGRSGSRHRARKILAQLKQVVARTQAILLAKSDK